MQKSRWALRYYRWPDDENWRMTLHLTLMNNPILQVQNVAKKYGNLSVLKDVSLTVEAGEIISIVGASGAGKSTLLHIAGTLDKADAGTVKINHTETGQLSERQLSRFRNQHIGFIFQFHHLLPEFSALENVSIPGWVSGTPKTDVTKKAIILLEKLGLEDRIHHKPNALSGGEQQRVAVARSLINNPSIVFADEPSGNLDSKNAREMHELFFRLRQELGQTFVIVTHNEELAEMSDRKLVMKDGFVL